MKYKLLAALLIALYVVPSFAGSSSSPKWISDLNAAQNAQQLVIVSGTNGSNARFSFHEKDSSGLWHEVIHAPAYIGKNGWGKTREGDVKTPTGVYTFTEAFGILEDPGCPMGYTQVDDSHYWVGDSNSGRYNQFVSIRDYDDFDKKESEHIIDYNPGYQYCLNISWNSDGTPKKGSAIFLHCYTKRKFTGGCVAIPEEIMREVVMRVKAGCVVVMDTAKNIRRY
ncbi:MAG: L,D-transpeptidase family protein [Synergistaceae bacterium]|nr:L,D-transpeptidase family protein [Synergistaceae bacterium]